MPVEQDDPKLIEKRRLEPKKVGLDKGPITKKGLSKAEKKLLTYAKEGQIINLMRLLAANEAMNINCQDEHGNTPLHYALMRQDNDMAWALLLADNRQRPRQANVHYQNNRQETLLHLVAKMADKDTAFEIGNELLTRHSNPFALDADGYSPLHWAAQTGNLALVKRLVAQGLVTDNPLLGQESSNRATALSLAIHAGHEDVAAFLKLRMKELGASEEAIEKSARGSGLALSYQTGVKPPDSVYHREKYKAIYANGEMLGHHIAYKHFHDGQIIKITEVDGSINEYKVNVLHNPQGYDSGNEKDGLVAYAFEPVDILKSQRIYMSFRGTDNLESFVADMDPKGPGYTLMQTQKEKLVIGINSITRRVNETIRQAVKEGKCPPKKVELCIGGHSLGGSLTQMFFVHLMQAKAIAKRRQELDTLDKNDKQKIHLMMKARLKAGLTPFAEFSDKKIDKMVEDFVKAVDDKNDPLHKAACYDALESIDKITLHTQNSAGVQASFDTMATAYAAYFNDPELIRSYNIQLDGDVVQKTCDRHILGHIPANWGAVDVIKFKHYHDSFLPQLRAHRINNFVNSAAVRDLTRPMATYERRYSGSQKVAMASLGGVAMTLLAPELVILAVAVTLYAIMKPFAMLYNRLRFGAQDYSVRANSSAPDYLMNKWPDYTSCSNAPSSCPHGLLDRKQLAAELNNKINGFVLRSLQRFIFSHVLFLKYVDHSVRHYFIGEPRGRFLDPYTVNDSKSSFEYSYSQRRQEEELRKTVTYSDIRKSAVVSQDELLEAKSRLKLGNKPNVGTQSDK